MSTTKTILSTTVYGEASGNYDGSSQDWVSDAVNAADYYRGYGGVQTVAYRLVGFVGILHVEGTLSSVAADANWFNIFSVGDPAFPLTDYRSDPTVGNFTWMRVRVEGFSGGTINSVTITY